MRRIKACREAIGREGGAGGYRSLSKLITAHRCGSGKGTATPQVKPFWNILYRHNADEILAGHAHYYERFAPITPAGVSGPENGIRQFVVGTGGEPGGSESYPADAPNMQVMKTKTPGVLKLNLGAGSYAWRFVPIAGKTFTDSGRDRCH